MNGFEKMNEMGARKTPFVALISYDLKQVYTYSLAELQEQGIVVQFPNYTNENAEIKFNNSNLEINKTIIDIQEYTEGFKEVHENILYGNSFLCNYTCSTPITLNGNLQDVYAQAKAKYKILMPAQWVCFSPETFIKIKDNSINTYPMKGTIDAALPMASISILEDPKETAEHYTIVDLLRNDLSMVAENVMVKKFRYIDTIKTKYKNLLQVSSHISGELASDWYKNIGTILKTLLPAGSISGAPKRKTLEIIATAEKHARGFYTGVAVYYDGTQLDSCVLIRFIEKDKNAYVYKSGGGITHMSQAETEYAELNDKIYIPTA